MPALKAFVHGQVFGQCQSICDFAFSTVLSSATICGIGEQFIIHPTKAAVCQGKYNSSECGQNLSQKMRYGDSGWTEIKCIFWFGLKKRWFYEAATAEWNSRSFGINFPGFRFFWWTTVLNYISAGKKEEKVSRFPHMARWHRRHGKWAQYFLRKLRPLNFSTPKHKHKATYDTFQQKRDVLSVRWALSHRNVRACANASAVLVLSPAVQIQTFYPRLNHAKRWYRTKNGQSAVSIFYQN